MREVEITLEGSPAVLSEMERLPALKEVNAAVTRVGGKVLVKLDLGSAPKPLLTVFSQLLFCTGITPSVSVDGKRVPEVGAAYNQLLKAIETGQFRAVPPSVPGRFPWKWIALVVLLGAVGLVAVIASQSMR